MAEKKALSFWPSDQASRLRLWLMLLCLATIALVGAVMTLLLNRSIADRMLIREAEVSQEFLVSALRADGAEEDSLFAAPAPSPSLVRLGVQLQNIPDIVRANVYSADGFIRHSTEPGLIGVKFAGNDDLREAFAGRLIARISEISDTTKSEHLAVNRTGSDALLEAYIPVFGKSGKLLCVVELYRLPGRIAAAMADVRTIVRAAWATGGLVLFLAFYVFFLRALPP
jgi:hypothetical protein